MIYWITSDIQQECYNKVKNKIELNLYEKCSVYSLHLGICTFSWILSPEASLQQCLCTIHSDRIWELHSRYISRKFMNYEKKYIGTKYAFGNLRWSLALNGTYYHGDYIAPKDYKFVYPDLKCPTYIGPFKFHEGLIRHLQDIGWLSVPRIKWMIK